MKTIRTIIGLTLLAFFIFSSVKILGLKTEYSVSQFYPEKHTLLMNHEEIRGKFRLNEESPYIFVIQFENESWLSQRKIDLLKEFSDKIQARQDVAQILSMTHVEGASNQEDEMVIGNLFQRYPENQWEEKVRQNPLLSPLLISSDFKSTLVAVESKAKSATELKKFESSLRSEIAEYFPKAKLVIGGVPVLQDRLSTIIQEELTNFLILIAIAFCLIFYFLFSHWSAIAAVFVTLITSNIYALCILCLLGVSMNAILVTLPVIISVSVVSLLIHTLHLWTFKIRPEMSHEEKSIAAFNTLKEIWLPNLLGILTTALGFLALIPSPIPLISQYGLIVALTLGGVAALSHGIIFLILPYTTARMRSWLDKPSKWALWSFYHAKLVLIPSVLFILIGTGTLKKLNFSMQLFDDLPQDDEVRDATNWIDREFGGTITYELNAVSSQDQFWKEPANLNQLQKFAAHLKTNKNVSAVLTVADFFQGEVPATKGAVSETFFLFSMAEKNPLLSFLTEDARQLRISIRFPDLKSNEVNETKQWILDQSKDFFPAVSFSEGGMASYAHAINFEVSKALIHDFWQPLLLIGIFLIFMFRSFKWALISCIPNFIPPAALIGALALSQVSVKPGIALVFSIALGFAFNNTLYILSRYIQLKKQNIPHSLERAMLMEANPCMFESIVMLTGFSIFLTSDFSMNQTFGGFMLISIVAGFAADLFFLPAFLKVLPKIQMRRAYALPLAAITIGAISFGALANSDAKTILEKSQKLLDSKDDTATIEMKIIEANGEEKLRTLSLKTLREEGFSVIAKIQSPADIKDMAFLGNVDNEGNEKQWLYLPSSGKVRRLVTGKSKAGLLGSEISAEDLNSEAIKSSTVKLSKTDKEYYWIELTPNPEASEYSKVVTKISKSDHLPKFTAYYIQDKLKKTVSFKDYKKFGPVFRAQEMNVQNHMNGRSTIVKLSAVQVNTGLKAEDFSQSSLKD